MAIVVTEKMATWLAEPLSGFLLINKPVGQPSFQTVTVLRKLTGQQKIGFAGTLDPQATGLLIVGFNKATKLLDQWHQFPKTYEAEITLGKVSTTYDSEGKITPSGSPLRPSSAQALKSRRVGTAEIENALLKFTGRIEQLPPMYSAKKVQGVRLYELARRGQEVERSKQSVNIHKLEILGYEYPSLKLRIKCSTGTYIRSLAHDLGQALGCGAYLSRLERTAIGPLTVKKACRREQLTADNWQKYLLH